MGGTLYAGGAFGVKKWTGSTWQALPGIGGTVYALAAAGNTLYAGGSFYGYLARYDDTGWHPVSGLNSTVYALAANGPELFVGGRFSDAGSNVSADYVARWNGVNTWTALSSGTNGAVRSLTLGGTNVYAGGDFTRVDGTHVIGNHVGRWSVLTTGLTLQKTASATTVYANDLVTYTLSIHHVGTAPATAVVVRDHLPAGFTVDSVTPTGCTTSGRDVTCALGTLASGHWTSVRIRARAPTTGGTYRNMAVVGSNTPEIANGNDNADAVDVAVTALADLALTKTATPNPVVAGTRLTYTLQTTNNGPSQATSVQLTDTLPPTITVVSMTPGSPTCAQAGTQITCNFGNMNKGDTRSLTIIADVPADMPDGTILTNRAQVTSAVADTTTTNNSASTQTTVQSDADLNMVKHAASIVYVKDTLTYELLVTNHGPSQATDVRIIDPLPTGTNVLSMSPNCTKTEDTVTCPVGTLAVNATSPAYTITVGLDPNLADGTILANTATASASSGDSNSTNDSATAQTTVSTNPTPFQADMSLTKKGPKTMDAGSRLWYVLTVRNNGSLDATHVVVTDTLPANTFFHADGSDTRCSESGGIVTCSLGAMAAYATDQITLYADTLPWQSAGTVYVNQARVNADQPDWLLYNNAAEVRTAVTRHADLQVTKAASPESLVGGNIAYTITLHNAGPSTALNAQIVDTLPADVSVTSITPSAGTCTQAGNTLTCTIGDMARGQTITVLVTTAATAEGTLTNRVSASSSTPDSNIGNNAAQASTKVTGGGPATHTIGQVAVTANGFAPLGGNREQAVGTILLGNHYRLDNALIVLDYNTSTISGHGTLVLVKPMLSRAAMMLEQGDLSLFTGNLNVNGNTGVLTPAGGATYAFQDVRGFALDGAPTQFQTDLLGGNTTMHVALVVRPPGLNTTLGANVTVAPGPTMTGSLSPFTLTLASTTLAVTRATLGQDGITVQQGTLTLPSQWGGGATAFNGLIITPNSLYFSGGNIALPDIVFGPHLKLTNLNGSFAFAFGAFVLSANGQVLVNIPNNIARVDAHDIFLDGNGNLSGSVDWLQLKISGGPLDMKDVQVNNDGLLAPTGKWTMPNSFGGGSRIVYLTDIPITGDGIVLGKSAVLTLPDVKLGNKVSFTGMQGQFIKQNNRIRLDISGTLNLYLPQNNESTSFSASLDNQGNFSGLVNELTLKLAAAEMKLTKVQITSDGLKVKRGTITLPEDMGGVQGIVNDVTIDSSGLSIGGGGVGIPLPDFSVSSVFSVTQSMLTFEVASNNTYKVTVKGTIRLAVKSLNAEATTSISLDSQGNVNGSIQSLTINIAGLGLGMQKVTIDKTGFFASKASLEVPKAWGGLTAEVYNIRIDKSGVSVGGGKFKLPDIKVGKVTLAGLEGSFMEAPGGYEIGAGGTFVIPGLGGGSSCGISVSVTLFVDKQGRTVARIQPAQTASVLPSLLNQTVRTGTMRNTGFLPEDAEAIQGLALRNVSVGLTGCSIPIGNTGLYLTRVSGSLTLNQGTTRIDLGVTVAGGPELLGVRAIEGSVDLGLQFNPFQMDMVGGISLFSIFKLAQMSATLRPNYFSASLHIVQIWPPFEGNASLTIWTDGGFHLVGHATLTLGFSKGALGRGCVPVIEWPCIDLPPFDLRLAEVGADFGEFVKDNGTTWGLKAWVTVGVFALHLTVTLGVYFDTSGHFALGNVDKYQTVTPPSVMLARALWNDIQNGRRPLASLSKEERKILRTYTFKQDDIYVAVPVAAPTDMLILFSRETQRPGFSLIRPDGLEITPNSAPPNVGFEDNVITGKDASGHERSATQTTVVVKAARPGIWRIKLSGPMTQNDTYVLQVNGIDPAPVLRNITVTPAGNNTAALGWSLVSNDITTTLNIYANSGPITTTQVVTDSQGLTKTITIPFFGGVPIATSVQTPLDGTPASLNMDLSHLESGTYHIWFDANDGRNPPIRTYADTTVEVRHDWQPTWTAGVHATTTYRQATIAWERSPNPDVDGYRLRINGLLAHFRARGLRVARALNTPPEIDVGDVISYTLYNLAPDQPYYITVLAVDKDTGRVAPSEEIAVVPQSATFDVGASRTDITLRGGESTRFILHVSTPLSTYPSTVSIAQGAHPDGLLLTPATTVVTPTTAGVSVPVTVTATADVPNGTYDLALVATGGGMERALPVRVTVESPDFNLAATPATITLPPGGTAQVTISAQSQNGETRPVLLTLDPTSFPAWLEYHLAASTLPMAGSVTLVFTDTRHLRGGDYTLDVQGRVGNRGHDLHIPLTVAKPNVSLAAVMARKVALPGETVTYTLNLTGGPTGTAVQLHLANPVPNTTWGFLAQAGDTPTPSLTTQVPGRALLVMHIPADMALGMYRPEARATGDGWETVLPLQLWVQNNNTGADVGVVHTAFPDLLAGAANPYTLTVTNYGPQVATDVVITASVGNATLVDATPAQGSCTTADATVTCHLGDLARDAQATIRVMAQPAATLADGTVMTATAEVSTGAGDIAPGNNHDARNALVRTQADLALSVDAPTTVPAGTEFTYRLTVRNQGPADANDVAFEDTLPAAVDMLSAHSGQGTCTVKGQSALCHLGTLPAGASTDVSLQVRVKGGADGTLANNASVNSTTVDPAQVNNALHTKTPITRRADLLLEASAAPSPAMAGRDLTYTFLVTNHGPSNISDAQVTVALPAGVTFLSGVPDCTASGGTVTCTLGDLLSGEHRLVTLDVHVAPNQTNILSLQARVHSAADDPNPDNNGATLSTAVTALADLALSVTAAPNPAQAGGDILYTVLVTNIGPSQAADVVVTDTLPRQVQAQIVSASQGTCTTDAGQVTCRLDALAPGQAVAVGIRVRIPFLLAEVQVKNVARVSATTSDNAIENNEDAVVTLVQVGPTFRTFLPLATRGYPQ